MNADKPVGEAGEPGSTLDLSIVLRDPGIIRKALKIKLPGPLLLNGEDAARGAQSGGWACAQEARTTLVSKECLLSLIRRKKQGSSRLYP